MAIFTGNGIVTDDWRQLAPGEPLPPEGKVILTLTQWQELSAEVRAGDRALGLLLTPGPDISNILPDLVRFALVVIAFPKFTDGRGYSLARQLRSHYGYVGELRASGDILFDQLQLLARCGFDSFEITNAATLRLLEAGRRPFFEIFYQPGLGPEVGEKTRPWARRASA
jgi:uncharacterized protein (DUF934 family)